ncbi:MAG: hypothetical protein DRP85_06365 [Candidatus Makaraimicrobium thalassicum]|nr:MAG: hypothetical protein DRP85_06365 [Candidatus Omnitrophota bacterium]
MDMNKIQNKIDFELSRTYFKDAARGKDSINLKKVGKRFVRLKQVNFFAIILVLAGGLIIFAAYFLQYKHVPVNAGTSIRPVPGAGVKETIAGKTLEIVIPTIALVKHIPDALLAKQVSKGLGTLYDFEENSEGWGIPGWAFDKADHVARSLKQTEDFASKGTGSIKLYTEFPGEKWTAALVEIQQYIDLKDYDTLQADIYLPPEAPERLRGKLIFTAGEDWQFIEMTRGVRLKPGEWTTVRADISDSSTDWKRIKMDKNFKTDIRKIAVRIESNAIPYSGPVYIDNIRVGSTLNN